jgi:hypothetical protein
MRIRRHPANKIAGRDRLTRSLADFAKLVAQFFTAQFKEAATDIGVVWLVQHSAT